MKDMRRRGQIAVSVYCLAYNQEKYIRRALEGMVRQKTDFDFEVIVHDDASTDGTARIIRRYAAGYPELIRPVYQTENQWSKGISMVETYILPRVRGRYIAVCEGDDYWTDLHKLQKQYDYMEAHPDCTLCFTNAVIRNDAKGTRRVFIPYSKRDAEQYDPGKEDYDLHDSYRLTFIPMASLFFRKTCYEELMRSPVRHCPVDDLRLRLFITSMGYAHFINEKTCVYREGDAGSMMGNWEWLDREKIRDNALRNYGMLTDLDKYTEYAFHEGLLPFMASTAAGMLENASIFELFKNPAYREIFGTMKTERRIKTLLKAVSPRWLNLRGRRRTKRAKSTGTVR